MKLCVFGGLFGSEGKGSTAEFFAKNRNAVYGGGSVLGDTRKLLVFGENSPNSGHTCSAGKTRNMPATSFFADGVVLGPDSVIDLLVFQEDLERIGKWRLANGYKFMPDIYIHDHASLLFPDIDTVEEKGVMARVSSTGSGSGHARVAKLFDRHMERVFAHNSKAKGVLQDLGVRFVGRYQWLTLIHGAIDWDWIFECSQGVLLDPNWGYYPYVTARCTLPRVSIARNGLGEFPWEYCGVYRTFPIRTGGPSGPTGAPELNWKNDIGIEPEIATVTKRQRRVFKASPDDYFLSTRLTYPDTVVFTHCDYLGGTLEHHKVDEFLKWTADIGFDFSLYPSKSMYISYEPGKLIYVPIAVINH